MSGQSLSGGDERRHRSTSTSALTEFETPLIDASDLR